MLEFVFAAITVVLIAGSLLGRMNFLAWMIFVPRKFFHLLERKDASLIGKFKSGLPFLTPSVPFPFGPEVSSSNSVSSIIPVDTLFTYLPVPPVS